jgi:4-amino-4-deoxy-L-arabinose transferase-like glycosyltransferase
LRRRAKSFAYGLFVVSALTVYFSRNHAEEPFFEDEKATLAQTYFYRLAKEGRWQDVDWLHQASYDSLNVGRTLAGAALDLAGYPLPTSIDDMDRWWADKDWAQSPPADSGPLLAARWPMHLGAAIGCLAMYLLVQQIVNPFSGGLAALLLAVSPVYVVHARRAMADDWVVALALVALALTVRTARTVVDNRRRAFLVSCLQSILTGAVLGLCVGTKWSGIGSLITFCLSVGILLAVIAPWRKTGPHHRDVKNFGFMAILTVVVASATFLAVNPFFWTQPHLRVEGESAEVVVVNGQPLPRDYVDNHLKPLSEIGVWDRVRYALVYRDNILHDMIAKNQFPEHLLRSPQERLVAMATDGLGRWSFLAVLGLPRSASAAIGLLLALGGVWWLLAASRRLWFMGQLPYPAIVAVWALVEVAILSRQLTLNWDRYYLTLVAALCALSAIAVGGILQSISKSLILSPPDPTPTGNSSHE